MVELVVYRYFNNSKMRLKSFRYTSEDQLLTYINLLSVDYPNLLDFLRKQENLNSEYYYEMAKI